MQELARGRWLEIQERRNRIRVPKRQWEVYEKKLRFLCRDNRQLLQGFCVQRRSGQAAVTLKRRFDAAGKQKHEYEKLGKTNTVYENRVVFPNDSPSVRGVWLA
jgi:hypothetical protein